jgi:hypothetical protein
LPAGLPVLCALVGLLTLVKPPRARPAAEPGETNLTGRPTPVEEAGKPVEKPVEQAGKPVGKPVEQAGKQETAAESC